MIYLADKAPGDVVDYALDMSEFVPAGFSIDQVTVEVTDAGNTESPVTLVAQDVSSQPLSPDDEFSLEILFWLSGGSPGVRYRGEITLSDDQSVSPDRSYVRIFEVMVKPL